MLLTLPETATALRCSLYTVRRRIREGDLPAVRLSPRSTRVDQDVLKSYIARKSTAPGAGASRA